MELVCNTLAVSSRTGGADVALQNRKKSLTARPRIQAAIICTSC
jgi:hypothetical protein